MTLITTARHLRGKLTQHRLYPLMLLLGIASGLPSALIASTLQAWFTEAGLDLHAIGMVTLLSLPYSLRFLWAPIFDRVRIRGLDQQRGWLLILQSGLVMMISGMALLKPETIFHLPLFATIPSLKIHALLLAGFLLAILSASQDLVIVAWQTAIFPAEDHGFSAALYVAGWRVGAIVSGAVALVLAEFYGWKITYLCMATIMAMTLPVTLLCPPAPEAETKTQAFFSLFSTLPGMIRKLVGEKSVIPLFALILLLLTYKLAEALALALNTTFLLRACGFSLATLGLINKTVSMGAALLGGLVAGLAMKKISLYRALLTFGLIQGVANLGYAILALAGKSYILLTITAFLENFCSGMGNIALVALLMRFSRGSETATRFALLSALVFLPRAFVGQPAAILVQHAGWPVFFVLCFLLSLPVLLCIRFCKPLLF